jgi:TolB protein
VAFIAKAVIAAGSVAMAVASTAATEEVLIISSRNSLPEVFTVPADGGAAKRLFETEGGVFEAQWSPRGDQVALVVAVGAYAHVFVGDAMGGRLRQLTHGDHLNTMPRWSPDGRTIAFVSYRDGNAEIYTMASDGGSQRRLTEYPQDDSAPSWSPDGRRLAYLRNMGRRDIWVMRADGSEQVNLTRTPNVDDNEPVWAPDGERVLFNTRKEGVAEIYSIKLDGTDRKNITTNGAFNHGVKFSPDGRHIAFVSNLGSAGGRIWVMEASGASPRRLSTSEMGDDWQVEWSTDGKRVYFVSMRNVRPTVFTVSASGGEERAITHGIGQDTSPQVRPSATQRVVSRAGAR